MDNNTNLDRLLATSATPVRTASENLIAGVFAWMFFALCISGIFSYVVGNNPQFLSYILNPETGRSTGLGLLVMFSPLALVLLLSFGYQKLDFAPLAGIFILFAALMGIGLSTIFLVYTSSSIAATFGISGLTFGIMAITGYRTHTDLTKFGSLMIMALIGIIIASVVNFFLHSQGLYYIISFAGVAIFTGLTAYDVQKIKNMSLDAEQNGWDTRKLTIMGALTLYLDFVNLFLFMLRFFGRRR